MNSSSGLLGDTGGVTIYVENKNEVVEARKKVIAKEKDILSNRKIQYPSDSPMNSKSIKYGFFIILALVALTWTALFVLNY